MIWDILKLYHFPTFITFLFNMNILYMFLIIILIVKLITLFTLYHVSKTKSLMKNLFMRPNLETICLTIVDFRLNLTLVVISFFTEQRVRDLFLFCCSLIVEKKRIGWFVFWDNRQACIVMLSAVE